MSDLRQLVSRGTQKALAEKHNVSAAYINRVLAGEANNPVILEDAIKMAEEEMKRRQSLQKRLHHLMKDANKVQ